MKKKSDVAVIIVNSILQGIIGGIVKCTNWAAIQLKEKEKLEEEN